jgi:hypothetical protein
VCRRIALNELLVQERLCGALPRLKWEVRGVLGEGRGTVCFRQLDPEVMLPPEVLERRILFCRERLRHVCIVVLGICGQGQVPRVLGECNLLVPALLTTCLTWTHQHR